ncbi:MAG: helix-turn-helix domain-containing protein [Ferruginibacter sp.]
MKDLSVGKKIKELRLRSGMSQDVLAEISQLSLRTIQRIENGETEPRGDSLKRISKALHVPVEELVDSIKREFQGYALKEDKGILLLLNISVFGFLIFPLLGIVFPMILWYLFKDKFRGVYETGRKIFKSQVYWCGILFIVYLYVFCLKFFHLSLLVPQNQKTVVVIIVALYVYNIIDVLIDIIKCFMIKKKYLQTRIEFLIPPFAQPRL